MGRHSTFNQDIADKICERLEAGESLTQICKTEGFPPSSTVRDWAVAVDSFSVQYTRARDLGLDAVADEVLAIADDGSADMVTRYRENGSTYEALDTEHIARSKLRFDARRWYLSKLAPKKYGDRIEAQLTGAGGGPITLNIIPVASTDKNSSNS